MSRKAYLLALPLIGFTAWIATGALATTHDFFKGKTMRIAVGASAGGRLTPTVELSAVTCRVWSQRVCQFHLAPADLTNRGWREGRPSPMSDVFKSAAFSRLRNASILALCQQLKRRGGVDFCCVTNFLQQNNFLIGVRKAQIAGAEHNRLYAGAIKKTGVQSGRRIEPLCLPPG
jgi:hypothetical protein